MYMFLVNRHFKVYKYNIKYAMKVDKMYNSLTIELKKQKIYGCRCVDLRHREMMKYIDKGLVSHDEYKHWKISKKIV